MTLEFAGSGGTAHILAPPRTPTIGEIDPRCVKETNELPKLTPYQASARAWRPGRDLWSAITAAARGRGVRAVVHGYRQREPGTVLSRGAVNLAVASDPVGAPIFYRDVPLMPTANDEGVIRPLDQTAVPLIGWRLKDVARDDSRLLLTDMPTCANCHSFSGIL